MRGLLAAAARGGPRRAEPGLRRDRPVSPRDGMPDDDAALRRRVPGTGAVRTEEVGTRIAAALQ